MPTTRLKEFLERNHVQYVTLFHSPAYTAQEIAKAAHISGKAMVKTVMIKVDGQMAMAVLPAHHKVDLEALREAAGAGKVALASEQEFKSRFPDCEAGAMPPFGNLYDMDVYVDEALTEDEEIGFNAGSHSEILKMAYGDFEKLVKPRHVRFYN
ncbi:MAG: YbaK/EbsC family protein [Nitrospinae bacterium]|nr:YbaK/EbsC family protein [Nitrospinota bacterium]MBI5427856.1 YbaK/EbsC family protein [Nitrospinota bacterium]